MSSREAGKSRASRMRIQRCLASRVRAEILIVEASNRWTGTSIMVHGKNQGKCVNQLAKPEGFRLTTTTKSAAGRTIKFTPSAPGIVARVEQRAVVSTVVIALPTTAIDVVIWDYVCNRM